jgi:hypothetical protein
MGTTFVMPESTSDPRWCELHDMVLLRYEAHKRSFPEQHPPLGEDFLLCQACKTPLLDERSR